ARGSFHLAWNDGPRLDDLETVAFERDHPAACRVREQHHALDTEIDEDLRAHAVFLEPRMGVLIRRRTRRLREHFGDWRDAIAADEHNDAAPRSADHAHGFAEHVALPPFGAKRVVEEIVGMHA